MLLLPRLIEAESRGGNGDIKKALYPFQIAIPRAELLPPPPEGQRDKAEERVEQ
jgi:hypothetical protein